MSSFSQIEVCSLSILLVMQLMMQPVIGECQQRESTEFNIAFISNGHETGYLHWQSVVMIRANGLPLCTGTLIRPNVVLTAGHCIKLKRGDQGYLYDYSDDPGTLQVAGGQGGEKHLSYVADIIVHPLWKGNIGNTKADLALILLEDRIPQYPGIAIRELPLPQVGDDAIIVGFGADPTIESTTLEDATRHREGRTTIRDLTPYYIEIGGDSNTCNGDSGGPLLTYQDSEWRLTGVISFGTNSCETYSQGYVVNLASYCGWLNNAIMTFTGEDLGMRTCSRCNRDLNVNEEELEECIAEEMREGESTHSCAVGRESKQHDRSFFSLIEALFSMGIGDDIVSNF